MIFFGILFHSSTMASFKNSRTTILRLRYTFYSRCPQISKSTGFKYSVTSDGAREIEVSFFNISRVISAVWALARSCTNNYSLCFTSLFISEIIFSFSILQWCFAFTFVFGSTIQKFYQLPKSPQKPLLALEKLSFHRTIFSLAHLLS